jgi:hypothetical protein
MKVFRFPVILAVLAAGLLPISTTNAQRYTDIKVRPPLIIETPGPPPHRGWVWIPGHWRWSHRHHYWVWVRGHWAKRYIRELGIGTVHFDESVNFRLGGL